ncbi:peroxisome biogenesis factor 1-like [Tropilaelaps mercedesae]|uniref:Peroxisome biogenesis factor 1-like n=1 Tax=Tropilaelaps mercedesae TaxID=418985 RepID=A0A1V9XVD7_9ACAR|nr:peroxisome biogenesis factor 1-like [Tropilaelaps mercedesae]
MSGQTVNVSELKFHASKHCFLALPRHWQLQRSASVVTFSVVCISSGVKAHFSWNGEESNDDRLLVNAHVASRLGFKDGDEVVVCRVHGIATCSQVTLKPMNRSDWQILELNVSRVEYCLLDQIRILWTDLVFPIWVQPNVCAYVRVGSTTPSSNPLELCNSTEVHVMPEFEVPTPPLAPAAAASSSVIASIMKMVMNATETGTSEQVEDQAEDSEYDELEGLPLRKISARLIGNTGKAPQTEVTLISNKVNKRRFVAMVGRLETPEEAELRISKKQDPNVVVDPNAECVTLLQGNSIADNVESYNSTVTAGQRPGPIRSVLCSVRVRPNPWSDDDLVQCPLPLRRRLGLENCSRLLLEVRPGKLCPVTSVTLHPIINTNSAPESAQELQSLLRSTLRAQNTLLSNGSYLQLDNCGYIVGVKEDGWLNDKSTFTVIRGEILMRRPVPNSPNMLPIVNLDCIIESGIAGALDEISNPRHDAALGSTIGKRPETLAKDWGKLLDEALFRAPSVLVFDDLDGLCGQAFGPEGDQGHDGQYFARNSRIFRDLVHQARQMKVCFIVTAGSWNSLCGVLTKTDGLHLFADVLEMRPPSREERLDVFKVLCRQRGINLGDLSEFARRTEGFVARDLATLADRLMLNHVSRGISAKTDIRNAPKNSRRLCLHEFDMNFQKTIIFSK